MTDNRNIRRIGAKRHDRMSHKVHSYAKSQKQDDTERKGRCQQNQMFPAAHGVMQSERRLYMNPPRACSLLCGKHRIGITRNRRQRRDLRSFAGRRPACRKHGQKSNQNPENHPRQADPKSRHFRKPCGCYCP